MAIALDLVLSAVKAAFSHVRLPYLISLREKEPGEVDRTITLLEKVGLRTSFRLGVSLAHFLAGGIAVVITFQVLKINSFWAALGIVTGVMLGITVFEYLIERHFGCSRKIGDCADWLGCPAELLLLAGDQIDDRAAWNTRRKGIALRDG